MPELLGGVPAFSVDTGSCNYVTAHQLTLEDVNAGDTLIVRVWHFTLTAGGESAVAHVAVRVGDHDLLDEPVPIPAEGGLLRVEHVARVPIPAGTDVYFHLHNHGDNSWSLVELSTGPDGT